MNFSDFQTYIKENIKEYLPEKFKDASVSISTINKTNVTLQGLIVMLNDVNVTPTIYLDELFTHLQNGMPLDEIMRNIADTRVKYDVEQDINANDLTEFDKIKHKIVPELVSIDKNTAMLANRPYKAMDDLAVIYKIEINFPGINGEKASVPVSKDMIKLYDISLDELHAIAVANIDSVLKPDVISLSTLMREAGLPDLAIDDSTYVVRSSDGHKGAAAVLSPEVHQQLIRELGDYTLLPSSIHEMIAVSNNGDANANRLASLVMDVNKSYVSYEEQLSDNVYHLNSKTMSLEMANDPTHEQAHDHDVSQDKIKQPFYADIEH